MPSVHVHRPELCGFKRRHAEKGEEGGVCDPQVFCASKMLSFLARWRVRGRPAVRGTAGTGSVWDGVGEGKDPQIVHTLTNSDERDQELSELFT